MRPSLRLPYPGLSCRSWSKKSMTTRVSGFTLINSHLLRMTQLPKVENLLQGNQVLQKEELQRNSSQSMAVHGST